jgi:serine/threonine protein kinase
MSDPKKKISVNELNELLQAHHSLARFRVEEILGDGAFARSYRASERTDDGFRPTVLKVIHESSSAKAREWKTQRTFDSPYIVNLLAVEIHSGFPYPILQLEYCNKGELFDFIIENRGVMKEEHRARQGKPPFTEAFLAQWFQQMLLSVKVLHDNGVMHRDIKPPNFLLSETGTVLPDGTNEIVVKLADFGFADFIDKPTAEWLGSKGYFAPEQVQKIPYCNKVDSWALGICLYNLLSGRHPKPVPGERGWTPAVSFKFSDRDWQKTSKEAIDLVQSLLKMNPASRFSVDQALAHPWITGNAPMAPREDLHEHLRLWNAARKVRRVHFVANVVEKFGLLMPDDDVSDDDPDE